MFEIITLKTSTYALCRDIILQHRVDMLALSVFNIARHAGSFHQLVFSDHAACRVATKLVF